MPISVMKLDSEVLRGVDARAAGCGVSMQARAEAELESHSTDADVAAAATRELAAWDGGTAVLPINVVSAVPALARLDLPILFLRAGGPEEEISEPGDPIQRDHYGVAAGEYGVDCAQAMRGHHRLAPPKTPGAGDACYVVGVRRGQVRMFARAQDWRILPGDEGAGTPKRYAATFLVHQGGQWVNVDAETGAERVVGSVTEVEAEVVEQLAKVDILPDSRRRTHHWVEVA